jgi:hypothetical protein
MSELKKESRHKFDSLKICGQQKKEYNPAQCLTISGHKFMRYKITTQTVRLRLSHLAKIERI